MKKIMLIFTLIVVIPCFIFAYTGWYNDYVIIDANNGGDTYYWIGSDPSFGTQFNGHDFGTVLSLEITGADMKYWSDTQDRTGGAFYC